LALAELALAELALAELAYKSQRTRGPGLHWPTESQKNINSRKINM